MKVLVTGLFTQGGLFAIRRFGKMGFEVTAADNHKLAFGMYSKYVKKRIMLPRLKTNPVAYAEALLDELKKGKYDFYFPSLEELYLMSYYREEVLKYTQTVIPPHDEIVRLHDKGLLKQSVIDAGALYPETKVPKDMADAEAFIKTVDYPVYIKLRQSRNSTGLRLVKEPDKILAAYKDTIHRNNVPETQLPIIQQRIAGPEYAWSGLAQEGRVLGETFHVGVRYIPRSGGTTTCRKWKSHEGCSKDAYKFVEHIKYSGFISIDFMVDERTGKQYIIDINPRPSVCINVGYYSGVDLIPEWVKIAMGEKANILPKGKEEVKSSTHFADVFWLLQTYTTGPESWKERKQLRKEWWANRDEINYDIVSKDDPKPRMVLNTFLAVQMLKTLFTKSEASQLFLEYNAFNEELFLKQIKEQGKILPGLKKKTKEYKEESVKQVVEQD